MIKKLGLISAGTLLLTTQALAAGATVPEPGPLGLLVVGAAGIFIAKRFNKNK